MAVSVALAAAFSAGGSSALAQSCVAPPGTAGIEQYCESIPGPDKSHGPSDFGGPGHNGGGGGALPGRTTSALQHAGGDGKALLGIAKGTSDRKSTGSKHSSGPGASTGSAAKGSSDNPLSAVGSAVKSGTRAGPGYAWMLVIVALLFGGLGWMRFRRAQSRT